LIRRCEVRVISKILPFSLLFALSD